MRIAVIINSSAGAETPGNETILILNSFKARNVVPEVYQLKENALDQCLDKRFDVIAAAGGDGTINSVVNKCVERNLPLGIIPIGTLNHFAKDAGIPLEINGAVDTILRKNISRVDLAEVNGHYFLNNSSVGLYPKMVKHRDIQMERLGYSKWYAMFRALINVFKKFPLLRLRIKTEDHYSEIKTAFLFVGNNKYSMDLFNLGTRERIDAGLLTLHYPLASTKFAMLRFAFLALINKLHQAEDFFNSVCQEIEISSNRDELEVSADGEVLHFKAPLNYRIHPGKLQLIVPPR